MGLFNVGIGREPAEIGVAEYQKPDYQQFEKLANVNMALKQQELEKAQRKTKEWGDILNTDFSTKYGAEQIRIVQKGVGDIRNYLTEEVKKDPSFLNDPAKMMEIKAKFNQIKGLVSTLDRQADIITKNRELIQKDPYNTTYDKEYVAEYDKAKDDPIEYGTKNPDSEIGQFINTVSNSEQVKNLPDDYKRTVVREALLNKQLKPAIVNINIPDPTGGFGQDYSKSNAWIGGSRDINGTSEPSVFLNMKGYLLNGMDEKTQVKYITQATRDFDLKYNTDEKKAKILEEYQNETNKWGKTYSKYAGDPVINNLNSVNTGENITKDDLIAYDFYKNRGTKYVDVNKNATAYETTASRGEEDYEKTIASAANDNTAFINGLWGGIKVPIIYMAIKGGGVDGKVKMKMNNGIMQTNDPANASTGGWSSAGTFGDDIYFNNSSVTAYPVFTNKKIQMPDGSETDQPLSSQQQDLLKRDPKRFKRIYGNNVSYAVAVVGTNNATKQGIVVPVSKDGNTMNTYRSIAEKTKDKEYYDLIPNKAYLNEKEYNEFKKKVAKYSTMQNSNSNSSTPSTSGTATGGKVR